jgi:hypothetical protein
VADDLIEEKNAKKDNILNFFELVRSKMKDNYKTILTADALTLSNR